MPNASNQLDHPGNLCGQILGRLFAVWPCNRSYNLVTKRLSGTVDADDDIVRLQLRKELDEHARKAKDSVRGLAGHRAFPSRPGSRKYALKIWAKPSMRYNCLDTKTLPVNGPSNEATQQILPIARQEIDDRHLEHRVRPG